ncbi:MAG: hypothetical protein WA134_02795 [Rhodoferax sp.]|uniref:hypothetical protein n=1 Tax=Rhodoferax sp. TaxID=50421 RepID=UPI003BB49C55
MNENNSVDASDLLDMPLPLLEELIFELEANAPGTDFVLTVVRWAAFMLICGSVCPDGTSPGDGFRRGMKMLSILRAHARC